MTIVEGFSELHQSEARGAARAGMSNRGISEPVECHRVNHPTAHLPLEVGIPRCRGVLKRPQISQPRLGIVSHTVEGNPCSNGGKDAERETDNSTNPLRHEDFP